MNAARAPFSRPARLRIHLHSIAFLAIFGASSAAAQDSSMPEPPAVEEPPPEGANVAPEEPTPPSVPPEEETVPPDEGVDETPPPPPPHGADTAGDAAAEEANEPREGRFTFGSYARASVASDLDGHSGSNADFTSRSPRIDEGTYAEIQLERADYFDANMETRIVFTLAFRGPLFHFDGNFAEDIGVRNLYLEVRNALAPGLSLWAGSRMVRGDDVYLHDFWPLDNLNMIGGGVRYETYNSLEAAVHVGMARPNEAFYTQTVSSVAYGSFLPSDVLLLDRPRLVVAGKLTYYPLDRRVPQGLKVIAYAELHEISSGQREDESMELEPLPSDGGYVLGAQVGGWIVENNAFANLFVRYARGLAAYDPLGVPFRVGSVMDTSRAEDVMVALSANYEAGMFGMQVGAHVHRLRDADPNVFNRGALTEGVLTLRPHVWFGEHVGIAAEGSFMALQTSTLDDLTGNLRQGSAWKFGLIPFFSPNGRGTYTRPHLRIIYALTLRDDDAQLLYAARDRRAQNGTEHFLGIGVEWWFDSSYRRE